jgi:hypothetical protein
LSEHIRILQDFPKVGMVTGLPIRQQVNVFTSGGLKRAEGEAGILIERGDFITHEAMEAYCLGVGRDMAEYKPGVASLKDVRLTSGNSSALLGACHFQFAAYKSVLKSFLPFSAHVLLDGSDQVTGSESELDHKIQAAELLRLSTNDVYVHHLGNTLTPRWRPWLSRLGLDQAEKSNRNIGSFEQRLSQNRYIRGVLMRFYNYVFRLYSNPTTVVLAKDPAKRSLSNARPGYSE